MARAVAYKTHTGLLLALVTEDGEHVVSITGTQTKELLRTPVRRAARKYFDGMKQHYEQRQKDEA